MRRWIVLMLVTSSVATARAQPAPVVLGSATAGCIAGAVELPPLGPGFETIRMSRSTFWGHPATVAGIELLGARAQAAGLATLQVNDLSRPRGGPTGGAHASHMTGLDVDIGMDLSPKPTLTPAERDAADPPSLVAAGGRSVDPARWRPDHVTLLRLAAGLPGIDRILVNPAIKQQLCRDAAGDRSWLRRVRPWYGHAAHMHLHFHCPPGQPSCVDAPPPPPGESCDATLQWWFDQLDAPPRPPARPPAPPPLPAACSAILALPASR